MTKHEHSSDCGHGHSHSHGHSHGDHHHEHSADCDHGATAQHVHSKDCDHDTSGKYIVVFKAGTPKDVIEKYVQSIQTDGGEIGHRYTSVLNGFSAKIPDNSLKSLTVEDFIDYIEPDGVVTTYAQSVGIGKK